MTTVAFRHTAMLLVALAGLASCAGPSEQAPAESGLVPPDQAYVEEFVQSLTDHGVTVRSVRQSKWSGFFPDTSKAAWIKTDQGVLNVVFFATAARADQIHVTPIADAAPDGSKYEVKDDGARASRFIDARQPLYFTIANDVFVVTADPDLDQTVKEMLAG